MPLSFWLLIKVDVDMLFDNSYGIVPLRRNGEEWQVLLVQHMSGHWAFPKGHAEKGETDQQAAERELKEETGLSVQSYLSKLNFYEDYKFRFNGQLISKKVTYLLAVVEGEVVLQEIEIKASLWVPLLEAESKMTFKEGKSLCRKVCELLIPSAKPLGK